MTTIPIIDISSSSGIAANGLLAAATSHGFIFVQNTNIAGLEPQAIEDMFKLSKEFFHIPSTIKGEISISSGTSGENRGWTGMHGEILDPGKQKKGDFKEAFNFSLHDPPQPLAGPLAEKRAQLVTFQQACHALCQRILGLFAVSLDIPSDWFEERHDLQKGCTGSILRTLYYPSLKRLKGTVGGDWEEYDEDVDVRAGAHSDYGSITLLFQQRGQPGLEILTAGNKWESVPVDPLHDGSNLPILVNIGDLLSYWTNGLLKSTVHRVIFPRAVKDDQGEDRYSMAYFCHPLDKAELVPVPSKMVEKMGGTEDAKAELRKVQALGGSSSVLTAGDHLNARLSATYSILK